MVDSPYLRNDEYDGILAECLMSDSDSPVSKAAEAPEPGADAPYLEAAEQGARSFIELAAAKLTSGSSPEQSQCVF